MFHVDRLKKGSLSGVVSWHGVGQEDGDGQHGHLGQPQHDLEPDHLVRNSLVLVLSGLGVVRLRRVLIPRRRSGQHEVDCA